MVEPPPERDHGLKLQVRTEREQAYVINQRIPGGRRGLVDVVRVSYRVDGRGRWVRFLLVPDKGQPLEELEEYAEHAGRATAGGRR